MPIHTEINDNWEFMKTPDAAFLAGRAAEGVEQIRLPHTAVTIPWNYTDEKAYQMEVGYRKQFYLPELGERRLFFRCYGAAQQTRLQWNGNTLCIHNCGYTAFGSELTSLVRKGRNLLTLLVSSKETLDQPPFGNQIDYLCYQGLYRNCELLLTGESFLADLHLHSKGSFLTVDSWVCGRKGDMIRVRVKTKDGKLITEKTESLERIENDSLPFPYGALVDETECLPYTITLECSSVVRWSPDAPTLYSVTVELLGHSGNVLDREVSSFGFRDAEFRTDGFYLNGKQLKLIGLDRHQSYPYVGYAFPAAAQELDADILKFELGLNIVRTSHYPQSQAFLNRCDEIGLLVFTEIPGWQHIGSEEWKEQAIQNVGDMVCQNRNHASIVLWGVRINESRDDDLLYEETNRLARTLDPYRQTGGVRCIRFSHLLEDVYTYNDFHHNGSNEGLANKSDVMEEPHPYLVTEHNGHMFPTKSFDDEKHRVEQALRHARVLDDMYGADGVSGSIGWCAFDYNTHRDFGSGDRICYHGVMDMNRIPKTAASVYASQSEIRPYLDISSNMDRGDYPEGVPHTVWAFTNADSVRMYRGDRLIGEFLPDRKTFPNLPHPPICIDDFIGDTLAEDEKLETKSAERIKRLFARYTLNEDERSIDFKKKLLEIKALDGMELSELKKLRDRYYGNWGDGSLPYRFEALKNGETVAESLKGAAEKLMIRAVPYHTELKDSGSWDCDLVRITAVDQYGNRLWYANDVIMAEAEGAVKLLSPCIFPLIGGAASVWIRTDGTAGNGSLRLSCRNQKLRIDYTVIGGDN